MSVSPSSILLEIQYLPSVQYFAKFLQYPKVVIEQHENYRKGSYRNRCHLATANGIQRLSIPLQKGKNEQQSIRSVQITTGVHWATQHWQAIQTAYGKAPFFEHYADELKPFFTSPPPLLFDFNLQLLEQLLSLLQIDTPWQLSDRYLHETPAELVDWRNGIHPKPHRQLDDPHFQALAYGQVFSERTGFLPNLSILDLIFCLGPMASFHLEKCIH